MTDIAKLLNEKASLRKQIIENRNDLNAVRRLEEKLKRIENQIDKLRGN